jgi:hypothetical protein
MRYLKPLRDPHTNKIELRVLEYGTEYGFVRAADDKGWVVHYHTPDYPLAGWAPTLGEAKCLFRMMTEVFDRGVVTGHKALS